MAVDPGRNDRTEPADRARSIGVTEVGGFIALVIALVELVDAIQSGRLVRILLLAAIALMVIAGIAVLRTMGKYRAILLVIVAVILTILIVITFFLINFGRLPLFSAGELEGPAVELPPSGAVATSDASPPHPMPSTSVSPSLSAPPAVLPIETTRPPALRQSPSVPRDIPPPQSLLPTTPISPDVTRGTFTSPFNGQRVKGQNLSVAGSVEGRSSTLLCIVKDESGNYFPYTAQRFDGQWTADVGIGPPPPKVTRPLPFTLILATATQSAVDEIHSRRENDPNYNEHGMGATLPVGIDALVEVGIVRDP
ncbi:MAG: hypothetical protein ACRDTF_07865 [Pseudonocardiaceae bacterium]